MKHQTQISLFFLQHRPPFAAQLAVAPCRQRNPTVADGLSALRVFASDRSSRNVGKWSNHVKAIPENIDHQRALVQRSDRDGPFGSRPTPEKTTCSRASLFGMSKNIMGYQGDHPKQGNLEQVAFTSLIGSNSTTRDGLAGNS